MLRRVSLWPQCTWRTPRGDMTHSFSCLHSSALITQCPCLLPLNHTLLKDSFTKRYHHLHNMLKVAPNRKGLTNNTSGLNWVMWQVRIKKTLPGVSFNMKQDWCEDPILPCVCYASRYQQALLSLWLKANKIWDIVVAGSYYCTWAFPLPAWLKIDTSDPHFLAGLTNHHRLIWFSTSSLAGGRVPFITWK